MHALENKPTILMVGNFLSSQGYSRCVCEDLSLRLERAGWIVHTTSHKSPRLARLADMLSTAWQLRKDYTAAQIDLYSGPAFRWAEAVCWLLKRLGKPFVVTLHGGNLPNFAHQHPSRVAKLLQSASVVTAPSQYLQEAMQPYRSGITLVPNPIELGAYHYRLRSPASPKLVWLRAFDDLYNPTLAPKVLSLLQAEMPDVRLTMVGPDKRDGSLQRTIEVAEKLGVVDQIQFVGEVDKSEVPHWLDQADIFLNTTNHDNTPVSVLEAMASGLCVVSTNVGGMKQLIADGEQGVLVPPDSPEEMAAAILAVLQSPALAERISSAGREKTENLDWSVILPQWESLFYELRM